MCISESLKIRFSPDCLALLKLSNSDVKKNNVLYLSIWGRGKYDFGTRPKSYFLVCKNFVKLIEIDFTKFFFSYKTLPDT